MFYILFHSGFILCQSQRKTIRYTLLESDSLSILCLTNICLFFVQELTVYLCLFSCCLDIHQSGRFLLHESYFYITLLDQAPALYFFDAHNLTDDICYVVAPMDTLALATLWLDSPNRRST